MAKFQFEKKQLLPAVGMGVASVGLFGWFVLKMTTPPPLQAAAEPVKAAIPITSGVRPGAPGAANATANAATPDDTSTDPLLTAPGPGMRDPFAPAIEDTPGKPGAPAQMASTKGIGSMPSIPRGIPSPPMGPIPPMGVSGSLPGGGQIGLGPATAGNAMQWTVTGVLSESSEPHNRVAILRSGDVRRFVRLGDMVDGSFRLVDVNRNGVTIADGAHRIHLSLGGDKKPAATHTPVPNGAATGPWTGAPTSTSAAPAAGQPASGAAPAQTPADVPGPAQAAPTVGTL